MNGPGSKTRRSPSHETTLETLSRTIEGLEEKIFGRSMAQGGPTYADDPAHYGADGQRAGHPNIAPARSLRDEIRARQARLSAQATPPAQPAPSGQGYHDARQTPPAYEPAPGQPYYTQQRQYAQPSSTAHPVGQQPTYPSASRSTHQAAPQNAPQAASYGQPDYGSEIHNSRQGLAPSNTSDRQDLLTLLNELRQELRSDMQAAMSKGFVELQRDVRDVKSAAQKQQVPLSIRQDLEKIANSIEQFDQAQQGYAPQHNPQQAIDSLRLEVDSLRSMIDKVARQDTLTNLDNRWGQIEENLREFQPGLLHSDVTGLATRLDEIRRAIEKTVHPGPVIAPLSDKVETIADSIAELLNRGQSGIDQRQLTDFGLQLEERLSQLVDKVDQLAHPHHSDLADRIDGLSARLNDLLSEGMVASLEERIAHLQHLVEQGSPEPQLPQVNSRLQELSDKMDVMNGRTTAVEAAGIERLVEQLAHIAGQFDDNKHDQSAVYFERVETQLHELRRDFDQNIQAGHAPNIDHLTDRTEQVLEMVRNLSLDDIHTRLGALQEHLNSNDDFILEAARLAAEEALKGAQFDHGDGKHEEAERAFLLALSDEVRSLDQVQRQHADENLEALSNVHAVLSKIAERLNQMGSDNDQHHLKHSAAQPAQPLPAEMPRAEGLNTQSEAAHDAQQTAQQAADDAQQTAHQAPLDHASAPALEPELSVENVAAHTEAVAPKAFPDAAVSDRAPEPSQKQDDNPAPSAPDHADGDPHKNKSEKRGSLLSGFKGLKRGKNKDAAGEQASVQDATGDRPDNSAPDHVREDANSMKQQAVAQPHRGATSAIDNDMADEPLEPGSGVPDLNSIMRKVQEVQRHNKKSDDETARLSDPEENIAAVRRAALIAAAEANKAQAEQEAALKAEKESTPLIRKPILIGAGVALAVILALPMGMRYLNLTSQPQQISAAPAQSATDEGALPNGSQANNAELAQTDDGENADAMIADSAVSDEQAVRDVTAAPQLAQINGGATNPVQDDVIASAPVPNSSDTQAGGVGIDQTNGLNYAKALALPKELAPDALRNAAANGDPLALYEIGARYSEARGVSADPVEAKDWFVMAAEQDFAPAQYRLGNIYENGIGFTRDLDLAKTYYQDAAANGHIKSMHNLGVIFASEGDSQDLALAAEWFKRAADYGVKDSQVNIAILYARGEGVARDLAESYKWFAIAAKNGDEGAADMRDQVVNALPEGSLASAQTNVDNWKALPIDVLANEVQVPDAWKGEATNTASIDVEKAIRNIQGILNNNGFDAGPPDGIIGDKTISAIRAFQISIGMEPTGRVSDELVRELLSRNG